MLWMVTGGEDKVDEIHQTMSRVDQGAGDYSSCEECDKFDWSALVQHHVFPSAAMRFVLQLHQ